MRLPKARALPGVATSRQVGSPISPSTELPARRRWAPAASGGMSPGRGSGDAGSGLRLGLAPEGLGRQPEKRGCAPRGGRSARETAWENRPKSQRKAEARRGGKNGSGSHARTPALLGGERHRAEDGAGSLGAQTTAPGARASDAPGPGARSAPPAPSRARPSVTTVPASNSLRRQKDPEAPRTRADARMPASDTLSRAVGSPARGSPRPPTLPTL